MLGLQLVEITVHAFQQSVVGYFCRVGNVREYRVYNVMVDGWQNLTYEPSSQFLPFLVDVLVASTTEVDSLEGASPLLPCGIYLQESHVARLPDDECLSRFQFVYVAGFDVERCLYDGSLAGKHEYLLVLVPECRTYAPRVAYGEHLSASRDAAHHVPSVP